MVIEGVLNDVAAPLFVLVMGITFTISGPSLHADSKQRRAFQIQTALRAMLLIMLGFALEFSYSGVNVVLDYIGVAMLLVVPVLFLSSRVLLWSSAALIALGPIVVMGARVAFNELFFTLPAPVQLALDWLVLGTGYQVVNFLPLVMIGIVFGRGGLKQRTLMSRLAVWSLAAYVPMRVLRPFVPEQFDVRGGVAEAWPELALALGTFATIVVLNDFAKPTTTKVFGALFVPIAAVGRMALSLYVLHVLILMAIYASIFTNPTSLFTPGSTPALLVQPALLLICWAFAAAWWRWLGKGPLERVFSLLTGRRARKVSN